MYKDLAYLLPTLGIAHYTSAVPHGLFPRATGSTNAILPRATGGLPPVSPESSQIQIFFGLAPTAAPVTSQFAHVFERAPMPQATSVLEPSIAPVGTLAPETVVAPTVASIVQGPENTAPANTYKKRQDGPTSVGGEWSIAPIETPAPGPPVQTGGESLPVVTPVPTFPAASALPFAPSWAPRPSVVPVSATEWA